jgi:hypothetical protein
LKTVPDDRQLFPIGSPTCQRWSPPPANGITAYRKNGGPLERPRGDGEPCLDAPTQLYDRLRDEVSLDEVERIVI